MTYDEFCVLQEQTFDSFCKTVIRNAAKDIRRELAARVTQEVSLDSLARCEQLALSAEDHYFNMPTKFVVRGVPVIVVDSELGQALQYLTPRRRDMVLLYYFCAHTETEIGEIFGLKPSSVKYNLTVALQRLRQLLEGIRRD
ncbi:MAG: sigma-70 family RNA polymerase sigma factor [Prevotellaceae bacterium]|nr:sigma-70 family RNA polymerase sigma factor [Prevotellaceae bacterium]